MKNSLFFMFFLITILIPIFFIPILSTVNTNNINTDYTYNIDYNSNFVWPIPGYTKISSPFGKREAPTGRSIKLS